MSKGFRNSQTFPAYSLNPFCWCNWISRFLITLSWWYCDCEPSYLAPTGDRCTCEASPLPTFQSAAASCILSPPWCGCPSCDLLNRMAGVFMAEVMSSFTMGITLYAKHRARHYGQYIERFGLKGAYSLIRQRNELTGQWWTACRRSKVSGLHTELLLLNFSRRPGDQVRWLFFKQIFLMFYSQSGSEAHQCGGKDSLWKADSPC